MAIRLIDLRYRIKGAKQAAAQVQKLAGAETELGTAAKDTADTLEHQEKALGATVSKVMDHRAALRKLSEHQRRFTTEQRQATQSAKEFGGAVGGLGKGLKAAAASLAAFVSVGALIGQFSKGVEFASDFEKGVANINTLLDEGSVPIERYRAQLRGLAKDSSKELNDLTTGLYQAISAGIPAVEGATGAFEFLRAGQKAAVAGLAETREGVDAIVTVFNAYKETGVSAAEISDKLFTTVKRGRTTFAQLSSSLGTVATTAATFGVTLDELLAQVATLTRSGFSVEEAVTSIQAAILGISSPSKQASDLAKSLGVDFSAAGLKANGFAGTLEKLRQATGNNADTMAALFPNVRALRGAVVLAGAGAQGFTEDLRALGDAAGATDEAHKKIKGTFEETAKVFKSQLQDTYIAAVERTMPRLQEVLERVGNYLVENQDRIARSVDSFVSGVIRVGEFIVKHGDTMVTFVTSFFAAGLIGKAAASLRAVKTELIAISATTQTINYGAYGAAAGGRFARGFSAAAGKIKGLLSGALKSPLLAATGFSIGWEIGTWIGEGIKSYRYDEDFWRLIDSAEKAAMEVRERLHLEGTGYKSIEEMKIARTQIAHGEALDIDGRAVLPSAARLLGSGVMEQAAEAQDIKFETRIRSLNEQLGKSRAAFEESASAADHWNQRFKELDQEFRSSPLAQLDGDFAKARSEAQSKANAALAEAARLEQEVLGYEGKINDAISAQSQLRSLVLAQERRIASEKALHAAEEADAERRLREERSESYRKWFKDLKKVRKEEERNRKARQAERKAAKARRLAAARKAARPAVPVVERFAKAYRTAEGVDVSDEAAEFARRRMEASVAMQERSPEGRTVNGRTGGLMGFAVSASVNAMVKMTQEVGKATAAFYEMLDPIGRLGEIGSSAFGMLQDGIGQAAASAIIHGQSFQKSIKAMTASILESVAVQAFSQAAYLSAIGIAMSAGIPIPGVGVFAAASAGAAFSSAAALAGVGAAAAVGARAFGGGGGGGAVQSVARQGGFDTPGASPSRAVTGGEASVVNYNINFGGRVFATEREVNQGFETALRKVGSLRGGSLAGSF